MHRLKILFGGCKRKHPPNNLIKLDFFHFDYYISIVYSHTDVLKCSCAWAPATFFARGGGQPEGLVVPAPTPNSGLKKSPRLDYSWSPSCAAMCDYLDWLKQFKVYSLLQYFANHHSTGTHAVTYFQIVICSKSLDRTRINANLQSFVSTTEVTILNCTKSG